VAGLGSDGDPGVAWSDRWPRRAKLGDVVEAALGSVVSPHDPFVAERGRRDEGLLRVRPPA